MLGEKLFFTNSIHVADFDGNKNKTKSGNLFIYVDLLIPSGRLGHVAGFR